MASSGVRQEMERALAEQRQRRGPRKPVTQPRPTTRPAAAAQGQEADESWDMKIAHPLAYGFDQAWSDLSTPLPASWEHKPTVPVPNDPISRTVGEGTRGLLDIGALFLAHRAGKAAVKKFVKPRIAREVRKDLRKKMRKKAKAKRPPAAPVEEVSLKRKKGQKFDPLVEVFHDDKGVEYIKMGDHADGRARFRRRSDGVVFIQRANGKFIPEHPKAKL